MNNLEISRIEKYLLEKYDFKVGDSRTLEFSNKNKNDFEPMNYIKFNSLYNEFNENFNLKLSELVKLDYTDFTPYEFSIETFKKRFENLEYFKNEITTLAQLIYFRQSQNIKTLVNNRINELFYKAEIHDYFALNEEEIYQLIFKESPKNEEQLVKLERLLTEIGFKWYTEIENDKRINYYKLELKANYFNSTISSNEKQVWEKYLDFLS